VELEEEQNMKMKQLTFLAAILALVLLASAPVLAQTAPSDIELTPSQEMDAVQTVDQPAVQDSTTQEPPTQEPPTQEPAAQEPAAQQPAAEVDCPAVFRAEQLELADTGVYPTSVSDQARACEDSGAFNPYPAPYFYDTDGFLYIYDPINARYTSDYDAAAGVYYIYDLVSDAFYTFDPVSGTYV
jgi:hypothetical protein